MKTFLTVFLTAALAVSATWFFLHPEEPHPPLTPASADAHAAGYQCAMHPWVKSHHPGRCTICGMELTPVEPGSQGRVSAEGVVTLSPTAVRVLNVETTAAAKREIERTLVFPGTIDDDATRHRVVSAYVDGRIEKLHVNHVGAEIAQGQPMASFYSQMLLVAESEYRLLEGHARESAGLRLRQMGLDSAQIAALPSKGNDSLTSDLNAPMTGTVVVQKVYEGQYVKQGDPLFEIADFSTMWMMFDVYESDLPWLQVGQAVDVTTRSLPGRTLAGKITFIDPNFDEVTRSTKARVELANPLVDGHRLISHRVFAEGRVRVIVPDALAVPRGALLRTGSEALVYVDQGDGSYQRKVVKAGRSGDHFTEILSGLKAGERVVDQGNLLIDGQAEINRSFVEKPADAAVPLDASQRETVEKFVTLGDTMAAALARDDVDGFNHAAASAVETTTGFVAMMKSRPSPSPALADLEQNEHLQGAVSLKDARMKFHAFIIAAEVVLQPLRHAEGAPPFQVWECPMVHEAIPGSAAKGRWIQTGGRPGGNPFFGKAMPDCGEEIQP